MKEEGSVAQLAGENAADARPSADPDIALAPFRVSTQFNVFSTILFAAQKISEAARGSSVEARPPVEAGPAKDVRAFLGRENPFLCRSPGLFHANPPK